MYELHLFSIFSSHDVFRIVVCMHYIWKATFWDPLSYHCVMNKVWTLLEFLFLCFKWNNIHCWLHDSKYYVMIWWSTFLVVDDRCTWRCRYSYVQLWPSVHRSRQLVIFSEGCVRDYRWRDRISTISVNIQWQQWALHQAFATKYLVAWNNINFVLNITLLMGL